MAHFTCVEAAQGVRGCGAGAGARAKGLQTRMRGGGETEMVMLWTANDNSAMVYTEMRRRSVHVLARLAVG